MAGALGTCPAAADVTAFDLGPAFGTLGGEAREHARGRGASDGGGTRGRAEGAHRCTGERGERAGAGAAPCRRLGAAWWQSLCSLCGVPMRLGAMHGVEAAGRAICPLYSRGASLLLLCARNGSPVHQARIAEAVARAEAAEAALATAEVGAASSLGLLLAAAHVAGRCSREEVSPPAQGHSRDPRGAPSPRSCRRKAAATLQCQPTVAFGHSGGAGRRGGGAGGDADGNDRRRGSRGGGRDRGRGGG